VNKPFKNRIREKWEYWMIEEGIQRGITRPPTRADISNWTLAAMDALPTQIVKKAWKPGEYTWFPNEMNNTSNGNISD
jgi:hypothetical protein